MHGLNENEYYVSWGQKDGLEEGQVITIHFYDNKVKNKKTQLKLK